MFVRPSHKSTVEGAKRNVIALDKKVVEEDEKEDDEEEPQSSQSSPLSKLRRRRRWFTQVFARPRKRERERTRTLIKGELRRAIAEMIKLLRGGAARRTEWKCVARRSVIAS